MLKHSVTVAQEGKSDQVSEMTQMANVGHHKVLVIPHQVRFYLQFHGLLFQLFVCKTQNVLCLLSKVTQYHFNIKNGSYPLCMIPRNTLSMNQWSTPIKKKTNSHRSMCVEVENKTVGHLLMKAPQISFFSAAFRKGVLVARETICRVTGLIPDKANVSILVSKAILNKPAYLLQTRCPFSLNPLGN